MLALSVAQEWAIEGSLTEPTEGMAKSGSDRRAPMATLSLLEMWIEDQW
jgi:hypothetical protein